MAHLSHNECAVVWHADAAVPQAGTLAQGQATACTRCPSCNLMPGCCTTRRTSVGSWTTFGCCVQTVFSKDGGPSNTARGQPGSELRGCSRLDMRLIFQKLQKCRIKYVHSRCFDILLHTTASELLLIVSIRSVPTTCNQGVNAPSA